MLALLAAALLPCVEPLPGGMYKEPPTLEALLACQKRMLRSIPAREHDEHEEAQRAEVRAYLERHPDRAALEPEEPAPQPAPRRRRAAANEAPGEASAQPPADLREAVERVQDSRDADIPVDNKSLEKMIWQRAPQPKNALTREQSSAVVRHLRENNRGEVDASTLDILGALSAEGGAPSERTQQLMRQKLLDAKSKGLNVGLDPDIEADLLRGPQQSGQRLGERAGACPRGTFCGSR